MKRITALDKDREFGVTVLAGSGRGLQKILSNSRFINNNLKGSACFAGKQKIKAVLRKRWFLIGLGRDCLKARFHCEHELEYSFFVY